MVGTVAARVWRGNLLENSHLAHVAVVDARGRVLHRCGDPARLTLVRSAAKPAQALAILDSGALEQFGFDDADLALICASHSSEPRHLEHAARMLARIGAREDDLRCGGHPPLSEAVRNDWIRRGFTPGALCSNCSGKHIGMLAAARALDLPWADYHAADHPLQQQVRHAVAHACALHDDAVDWAIDGCNLPTPALPLTHLAGFYARLAGASRPSVTTGGAPLPTDRQGQALGRVYRAMTGHPELVAGEGRFCTVLMQSMGGRLVGKVGADASYAIGVQPSGRTAALGAEDGLGIAVKVEDGNMMVLHAVVCEVLAQLDLLDDPARQALQPFHQPRLHNTVGLPTGHLSLEFALQS